MDHADLLVFPLHIHQFVLHFHLPLLHFNELFILCQHLFLLTRHLKERFHLHTNVTHALQWIWYWKMTVFNSFVTHDKSSNLNLAREIKVLRLVNRFLKCTENASSGRSTTFFPAKVLWLPWYRISAKVMHLISKIVKKYYDYEHS